MNDYILGFIIGITPMVILSLKYFSNSLKMKIISILIVSFLAAFFVFLTDAHAYTYKDYANVGSKPHSVSYCRDNSFTFRRLSDRDNFNRRHGSKKCMKSNLEYLITEFLFKSQVMTDEEIIKILRKFSGTRFAKLAQKAYQ